ncbi:MAG: hypothetical protein M1836_006351 [Candelina mexicana]|nr:MAG: hypothetical protein M1836_006351 [Candelina mexicana]
MSDIGEDEMDLGSNAGSQHEEEDFEGMIGTQAQEYHQSAEDMVELAYEPNALPTTPTPEPGATLESSEPVVGDSELVMLDHGIPSKQKANTSASPATHPQLQNIQLKAPKGFASPPSVVPETQTSEGPTPTQRSNFNRTRSKRSPKAIPADANIIDLDAVDLVINEERLQGSFLTVKQEDDCIGMGQGALSPKIKQEVDGQDRWIWSTTKDDPFLILDDDDHIPVQASSTRNALSPTASSPRAQPSMEASEARSNAEPRPLKSGSGVIEDCMNTNSVGNSPPQTIIVPAEVDAPMPDHELIDATSRTGAAWKGVVMPSLNLGKSILGKPNMSTKAKKDRKQQMIGMQKLWAEKGMKKASVGATSNSSHEPAPRPTASEGIDAESSADAQARAEDAEEDEYAWMTQPIEVEEGDPAEVFAKYKKKHQAKEKKGTASLEAQVAFRKAEKAEKARLNRLQEEERLRLADDEDLDINQDADDDNLFVNEFSKPSSNYKRPYAESDNSPSDMDMGDGDDEEDNQPSGNPKPSKRRKPNMPKQFSGVNVPKDAETASMMVGIAEDLAKTRRKELGKGGKAPRKSSTRAKKSKLNSTQSTAKSQSRSQGKNKGPSSKAPRGKPDLFKNMDSLLGSNIYEDAMKNRDRASQPGFSVKRKDHALKELLASVPEEDRKTATTDKNYMLKATKKFGYGRMKADGLGAWKLTGMKSSLFHYQVLGAAFMRDREQGVDCPLGGLNADEMGLGKTVMMIANIVSGHPPESNPYKSTLIVATPALVTQWMNEIRKHSEEGAIGEVIKYHAGNRVETNNTIQTLQRTNVILTTYTEVLKSYPKYRPPKKLITPQQKLDWWEEHFERNKGVLHRVMFHRIVLDEAQAIKNHTSRTSVACRGLMGKHKWAISGTLIQNSVEELYPYFKFLNVEHTGSCEVFKDNFCEKDSDIANQRLHSFLRQFMIRRTHLDELFGVPIVKLPNTYQYTIPVEFNPIERAVYNIVRKRFIERINGYAKYNTLDKKYKSILTMLLRLRMLTGHVFMVQETIQDLLEREDFEKLWALTDSEDTPSSRQNGMLSELRKMLKDKQARPNENSATETDAEAETPSGVEDRDESSNGGGFGLSFKFRQILETLKDASKWKDLENRSLCHRCREVPEEPQVTTCLHVYCRECLLAMMHEAAEDDQDGARCLECGIIFDGAQAQPCKGLEDLGWEDGSPSQEGQSPGKKKKNKKKKQDADNPQWVNIDGPLFPSAKTMGIKAQVLNWFSENPNEKIIIFTQFQTMIKLMARICGSEKWGYRQYHGKMDHKAREKALEKFGSDKHTKILLASLKCGGVGLNLTMASRVVCIDLWWNSSVEQQAFCRVFRIGQEKQTVVTRFVVKNSVDEAMQEMQLRKAREISRAMGDDGSKPGKLTVKELMRLFGPVTDPDEQGREFIWVDPEDEYGLPFAPVPMSEDDRTSRFGPLR